MGMKSREALEAAKKALDEGLMQDDDEEVKRVLTLIMEALEEPPDAQRWIVNDEELEEALENAVWLLKQDALHYHPRITRKVINILQACIQTG